MLIKIGKNNGSMIVDIHESSVESQGTFSSLVEELVIVAVLVYCHSVHIVIVLLMSLNAFCGLCIFLGYNFTW